MNLTWTKGIKDAQVKKSVNDQFNAAMLLRERLSKICVDKIEDARRANTSSASYESPNWGLKQADSVGYERALREIINLL